MIGLDFPVKPQWIHDVHALWQPAQPIGELVEAALAHTMQELGGEKTRRNSLTVILRYFVATEGGGQSRRTAERDVWVAYSRAYPASTMAPAYLAHLIAQNEVAQEATRFLVRRHALGDELDSSDVRRHTASPVRPTQGGDQCGQRFPAEPSVLWRAGRGRAQRGIPVCRPVAGVPRGVSARRLGLVAAASVTAD